MKFGVNIWVWTDPITTTELDVLVPLDYKMDYDPAEHPIEDPKPMDFEKFGCRMTNNLIASDPKLLFMRML